MHWRIERGAFEPLAGATKAACAACEFGGDVMANVHDISVEVRPLAAAAPMAPLPYPEHDVAANARRAHDVISEALKEARAIRKLLEAHGDPTEASRRLGLASDTIGAASFFLREAIAIKGITGKPPPSLRDLTP